MVLKNETTIEGPSPMFDMGVQRNCWQVFGKRPLFWILPIWGDGPDGNGVHWPVWPMPWSPADEESNMASCYAAEHPRERDREVLLPVGAAAPHGGSDSSLDEG